MKRKILLILISMLALLLAACGEDEEAETVEDSEDIEVGEEQPTVEDVEITDEEKVEADTAILSVNGTEITGDKYNNIYREIKMQKQLSGEDVSDLDALQKETIDSLTILELILQDAIERGIEVTDEEAEEEVENLREINGEEVIDAMLEEYEITEEEFRAQIVEDLTRIRYIESEFEVDVTDEEVEEQFEQLEEEHGEIGGLEENEELIRQMVIQQKQNDMLNTRIEELREDAEIETFI